ncbi:hypothetical protein LXA43DRAFT_579251 [Ganoderma leucocontextum]|nr:hypothetical protein LXA43DRAFT_579251 [Ganoderma leucocontextum]
MQTTTISRKPRGLPDLNFDISFQIISLLTRRDVASLSRTCRTLRNALSPELARGGVTLEARHLTSFLLFADMKHGQDRLRYLRKVVLPGSTYQSIARGEQAMSINDARRALSTVLLAARNLESLAIPDLNVISFRPASLKKVLNSLPRLRELEMSAVPKKYEGVLENALPRLRTLVLEFLDGCNASAFLERAYEAPRSELQEVALYGATFKKEAFMSFPAVHTLRACPAKFPSDVDALTRMFPNVEDLTLDSLHDYRGGVDSEYWTDVLWHADKPWGDPVAKTCRRRLLSRPQKKIDAWPHIQSLRVTGPGIRRIPWAGLTCRVPGWKCAAGSSRSSSSSAW